MKFPLLICLFPLLILSACKSPEDQFKLELEGSLNRFTKAVESRTEKDLTLTVYLPNQKHYRDYVNELLLKYLDDVANGKVTFDDQGIVLTRFLGIGYNRYMTLSVSKLDSQDAKMRIGIHFSYDSNILHSNMPEKTKFFIPGKPWGSVYTIEIGSENNPAPREQLKYLEIDILLRRTNLPGHWQVREMKVDPASIQYEVSLRTLFN